MITEDHSIASSSRIALGGTIKVELDKILRWRGPDGRAERVGGGRRGRESEGRMKRSPILEDWEFGGGTGGVCAGPFLKVHGFQDAASAVVPALLPWERKVPEDSSVSFFPGVPKDKAWKELPYTIEERRVEG
jgi:hypothetical protein